ncbi:MAG: hypothetical protein GY788_07865, partial [bacterium]|nr:hypothetical protein [bacterium]
VAETGTTDPTVGFQGDYTDPASDEVWMGARWYNGADAAFRSRDTVFGQLRTPVSLNRYTYGYANPLLYWDPDGRLGNVVDGAGAPIIGFGDDGTPIRAPIAQDRKDRHNQTVAESEQRIANYAYQLWYIEQYQAANPTPQTATELGGGDLDLGGLDHAISFSLSAVSATGEATTVRVDAVFNGNTVTLKMPDGSINVVPATGTADYLFAANTQGYTWADNVPSWMKSLDPKVVGELAFGADVVGTVFDVVTIGYDAYVGYQKDGNNGALHAIGRGTAQATGGVFGISQGALAGAAVCTASVWCVAAFLMIGGFAGEGLGGAAYDVGAAAAGALIPDWENAECPNPVSDLGSFASTPENERVEGCRYAEGVHFGDLN